MKTSKDLYWHNNQTPASRRFDDIYFSTDDGLMESRHVFLTGINAPEIWQNKARFTLLENGFGTGLNFIIACQAWLKSTEPDAHLTYIATEKHPLNKADIDRALSHWPELDAEKQALLNSTPPQSAGFHQRHLFEGRITLLLLIGDSAAMLNELDARVDAFYLDGFAPSRNPNMWSADVFSQLARLAAPSAKLASFTAAGFVRRGLSAHGFEMQKSPGFGKKRENLRGCYTGPTALDPKPWFNRPAPLAKDKKIALIGGGIAGMTTGLALQKRGYQVIIYEQDGQPMNRASGNPAGIIDPYLGGGPGGLFYRTALSHALDYYRALGPDIFLHKGLIKFPEQAAPIHFPDCGAISPPAIRTALSRALTIKTGGQITNISGLADMVIICGGPDSLTFPETKGLPLDPVRGQITLLNGEGCLTPPDRVLCGKGYLIPPVKINDKITLLTGASFHRGDSATDIRDSDHEENLNNARALWADVGDLAITGGRSAVRAHSPDHLPLCGPLPDVAAYITSYEMLKHGPKHRDFPPAPLLKNRYILSGLGARGFMTAPLMAEIITALISGDALPVPRRLYESLHPARFLIRRLIKGR
ncbi:MAG: FAD-dependent 5-carboxymethylaminomethyl-2-thiouridine(34) oxidoreductase MnmC [Emcibacter sp.]|nr:FAD-dependent 5-carboxymethylaminomethyl-2-thiouridine(34) oxidoreductase MnmC [Emcibacter sp.]